MAFTGNEILYFLLSINPEISKIRPPIPRQSWTEFIEKLVKRRFMHKSKSDIKPKNTNKLTDISTRFDTNLITSFYVLFHFCFFILVKSDIKVCV
jgi:hypothetical protein